jgi:hypothetical protein
MPTDPLAVVIASLVLTALCPAAPPPQGDQRDTVHFTSGKPLQCRVTLQLDDKIAVLVGSREKWIPRKKVARVETVQQTLRQVMMKFSQAEDSTGLFLELAKTCDQGKLPHEARLFYWRILADEPDHEVANAALGHKRAGKSWRVPVSAGWHKLDFADKLRASWGKAWRLRSEHFELRTDAGLRIAVLTLLDLENFYRHLFDLFQKSLELHEVTEPIQVQVYRDKAEFPRLSDTVDAYFSPGDNIHFTFIGDDGRPLTLFHEATHAVIFNLGGSHKGRRTELPGWLNEGWADYMEGCLAGGKDGRVKLDLARRCDYRIGNLRAEKDPYSLRRVINFKTSDFAASSKQKLKYAQSYALFLYMMEGESGKYSERFLGYMKDALVGKASASAFRSVFRKEMKTIEKDYLAMR